MERLRRKTMDERTAQWPSLPETAARAPQSPAADMEFDLQFLSPDELRAHPVYRERVRHMLDAPLTTTYCVASCETRRGPFIAILPINGRLAMNATNVTKTLIEEAQRELTRAWTEDVAA
jgi:hypothetical protein